MAGTARYASINAHLGSEQSRRDDMWSLLYVMCYFASGTLPWKGIQAKDKNVKYQLILKAKMEAKPEQLCKGLPTQYVTLFREVKKLKFDEEPNYDYYNKLLDTALAKNGLTEDDDFDWMNVTYNVAVKGEFLKRCEERNVFKKIKGVAALRAAEKEEEGYRKTVKEEVKEEEHGHRLDTNEGTGSSLAVHVPDLELSIVSNPSVNGKSQHETGGTVERKARRASSNELNKIGGGKGRSKPGEKHQRSKLSEKSTQGCGCMLL